MCTTFIWNVVLTKYILLSWVPQFSGQPSDSKKSGNLFLQKKLILIKMMTMIIICSDWELVKNVESEAPLQTYQIRVCILARFAMILTQMKVSEALLQCLVITTLPALRKEERGWESLPVDAHSYLHCKRTWWKFQITSQLGFTLQILKSVKCIFMKTNKRYIIIGKIFNLGKFLGGSGFRDAGALVFTAASVWSWLESWFNFMHQNHPLSQCYKLFCTLFVALLLW